MHKLMDKKNKDLIKKNTELLLEITKINAQHVDYVKENVKDKFTNEKNYNKILKDLDTNIKEIGILLENTKNLKEKFLLWRQKNKAKLQEKDVNIIDKKIKKKKVTNQIKKK